MRTSALYYSFMMFLILEVAIICSITSKSVYKDSVQESVDNAVSLSVSMLQSGQSEKINEDLGTSADSSLYANINMTGDASALGSYKTNFVRCLVKNIDSKVNRLDINILGADETNGMLSVEVTAYFSYLSGQEGQVSSYATVILNSTEKPKNGA